MHLKMVRILGEQRTAHGKATAEEEGRKTNMEEISNPAEQEFFQWLPNAVTPSVLKDIQKSYAQINVLLIKARALTQTLTSVTSIDEVEYALRRTEKERLPISAFATRLCSSLRLILSTFVKKKKLPVETKVLQKTVEIQPSWIKYDFTNAQSFERTAPVYCAIAGVRIEGKDWARSRRHYRAGAC